MRKIDLSIIIVVYTEFELLEKCLENILENTQPNMEVIVVQNKSERPGIEKVLKHFPTVRLHRNSTNAGFGAACNAGAKVATGTYLLFLTPDTKVRAGTIVKTLAVMETLPEVGLLSCPLYGADGSVQRTAFFAFPSLLSHLLEFAVPLYKLVQRVVPGFLFSAYTCKEILNGVQPVHLSGAYMLVRAQAFKEISGFDEQFFLYREETDLCKRLALHNWQVKLVPVGGVEHSGEGAAHHSFTQGSEHYMRSTYHFFAKHYGYLYASIAYFIGLMSAAVSILYLLIVFLIAKCMKNESHSAEQLRCWLKVLKWHIIAAYGYSQHRNNCSR